MAMYGESKGGYRKNSTVSVLQWILTFILSSIPVVNIVLFVIWAVSCKIPSKRNYAIASIICGVLWIVVLFVVIALFGDVIVQFLADLDTASLKAVTMN